MSEGKELEVRAEVVMDLQNPLDDSSENFQKGLQRRSENRNALMGWIKENLVEDIDFGKIHIMSKQKCPDGNRCTNKYHYSKPVLFKPGSEKILGMLNLKAEFQNLDKYEEAAIEGREIKQIILKCTIKNANGDEIANGVGGRSLAQDYGDLNKSLKMCKKSALIDATLQAGGLSEIFTQDLEDMVSKENKAKEHLKGKGAFSPKSGNDDAKKQGDTPKEEPVKHSHNGKKAPEESKAKSDDVAVLDFVRKTYVSLYNASTFPGKREFGELAKEIDPKAKSLNDMSQKDLEELGRLINHESSKIKNYDEQYEQSAGGCF